MTQAITKCAKCNKIITNSKDSQHFPLCDICRENKEEAQLDEIREATIRGVLQEMFKERIDLIRNNRVAKRGIL